MKHLFANKKIAEIVIGSLILIPFIYLIAHLSEIPYQPGSQYTDFEIAHLASANYLQYSLFDKREFPFWSSVINGGYPFYADPLSGIFYLPGWPGYLLPQPYGLNLLIIVHFFWLGLGTYLLCRFAGITRLYALICGLLVVIMPKLWAHYASGHVSTLFAVSWMPWAALSGYATSRSEKIFGRNLAAGAGALSFCALADPRWLFYTLLTFFIASFLGGRQNWRALGRSILQTVTAAALAVMGAALLFIPMLNFAAHSTRSAITAGDLLQYAVEPIELIKVILPVYGEQADRSIYIGAFVLFLSIIAWSRGKNRFTKTALILPVGFLIFYSFGEYFLPNVWLVGLPGFNLLRVPSRAWLVIGSWAVFFAVWQLDHLSKYPQPPTKAFKIASLSIVFLVIGIGAGISMFTRAVFPGAVTGVIVYGVIILSLLFWNRLGSRRAAILLAAGLIADYGIYAFLAVTYRPVPDVPQEIAVALKNNIPDGRIYSPTFSIPQSYAARYGLQLAGGIAPLIIKTYYDQFTSALGGAFPPGYSVTLPPIAAGNPLDNPAALAPDPEKIGELNVVWIFTQQELINSQQFDLIYSQEGYYLYRNLMARPLVEMSSSSSAAQASIETKDINRIVINAVGPGRITVRVPDYPGWRVSVDGLPAIMKPQGIFLGAEVPAGIHRVVFEFFPADLWYALCISAAGWLALAILWVRR